MFSTTAVLSSHLGSTLATSPLASALAAATTPGLTQPRAGGNNISGPTCGLPGEFSTMGNTIVAWEKGALVIILFVGLIASLILWGIGAGVNSRGLAEAGKMGVIAMLGIAVGAVVLGGILSALVGYIHC